MKKNQYLMAVLCLSVLTSCATKIEEEQTASAPVTEQLEQKEEKTEALVLPAGADDAFAVRYGQNFGPIKANMDKAMLVKAFGKENVTFDKTEWEGEEMIDTYVFKGTDNEIVIVWENANTMKGIRAVQVRSSQTKNKWLFPGGINLGSKLSEIQRLNGKPFTLAGFYGSEGAGATDSWEGGAFPESLSLIFDEELNMPKSLMGDVITSDLVLKENQDSKVRWITVELK